MSDAEDHSAANVDAGLDDARATIAEIWRRTCGIDDAARKRAMRALQAVISAEQTMRAADAFMMAKTRSARAEAFEKLRVSCALRCGHDMRKTP